MPASRAAATALAGVGRLSVRPSAASSRTTLASVKGRWPESAFSSVDRLIFAWSARCWRVMPAARQHLAHLDGDLVIFLVGKGLLGHAGSGLTFPHNSTKGCHQQGRRGPYAASRNRRRPNYTLAAQSASWRILISAGTGLLERTMSIHRIARHAAFHRPRCALAHSSRRCCRPSPWLPISSSSPAKWAPAPCSSNRPKPGKYVEAPRVATDFDITVTGPIARTRVTQQFNNPTEGWVEGVYVFPLPDNAAVDTLKMVIGERRHHRRHQGTAGSQADLRRGEGQGREGGAARAGAAQHLHQPGRQYRSRRDDRRRRSNIRKRSGNRAACSRCACRSSSAPRYNPDPQIEMSGETGTQVLVVRLACPTASASNRRCSIRASTRRSIPVTLTVHLNPGFALGDVKSSFHDVDIKTTAPDSEVVTLAESEFADRDFELTWQPKPGSRARRSACSARKPAATTMRSPS